MQKMTRNDALLIRQAVFSGCDDFAKEYLVRKGFAYFEPSARRDIGHGFYIHTEAAERSAAMLSPPNG